MRAAGLDIGSRSIELVIIETAGDGVVAAGGGVVSAVQAETTPRVAEDCARLLRENEYDRLLVTGYGRALAEIAFQASSITEIKAYARGAQAVLPGCRGVLDIGGQDTKVIALDGAGRVLRFEMNDRCAAGAGRFLEMMASALSYDIAAFGEGAASGRPGVQLSSMCAVFAESEVIGLLTRGAAREDVALAVHQVIARRTAAMLTRVGLEFPIVFAGGAARCDCLRRLLQAQLGPSDVDGESSRRLFVPEQPQMLGALGAALLAAEMEA
jgi:(R)-2-hydroxyacyl-CoA dehydratese activating ATPase